MSRFHISDTHFGHKNIISYCERPFTDFHHMDEIMVQNWNSVVGPNDVVYHHGDVAMGDFKRWNDILTSLNGYKVLIIGNHDRVFSANKDKIIDRYWDDYANWFDEIYDNYVGHKMIDGTVVNLSHFPYDGDSHDADRYTEQRLLDDGNVLIHGHTHSSEVISRSARDTLQIHVGVDAHNFAPVPEESIIELIKENS
jgi:calcineurin-like phosphoesterase family protein